MTMETVTSISLTELMSNTTDSLTNSSSPSDSPQQYVSLPPTLLLLLVLLLYLPIILTTVTGDLLLLASVVRAPKLRTQSNACLVNLAVSSNREQYVKVSLSHSQLWGQSLLYHHISKECHIFVNESYNYTKQHHKYIVFCPHSLSLCTLPGRRPGIAEGNERTRLGRVHLYFVLLSY